MKLSIIIVSYNEAEYLPQAIDSCLEQRLHMPYEIIVGDDGSSDNSLSVIRSYAERFPDRIRYFVMDREDGVVIPSLRVSNVIKKALASARGEYIQCLSGDDYFCDPDKFGREIALLDTNRRLIACVSDYKRVWEDGTEEKCTGGGIGRLCFGAAPTHIYHASCGAEVYMTWAICRSTSVMTQV